MKHLLTAVIFFCASLAVHAQMVITGTVTDHDSQPLIGVSVFEKNTNNGAITDDKGNYTIEVGKNTTLVYSYVGYAKQEIVVGTQTKINVQLEDASTELAAVQIVGSRSLNRSITNTAVPIDYIDLKKVANDQGQLDVNQLLTYLAPSFNANRQSGSDAADHTDPASLRGLGPDQTLVLINGKRLHQTSLINIYGTRGRGNTGTDLDAIPVSAIDHIEILRDGASAQYGSDAIAGVINIVLKTSTGEFTGNINGGANVASYRPDNQIFDGGQIQFNGNYGLPVGDKGGFINFSFDYLDRGHTNRVNEPFFPDHNDARTQFGEAAADNSGIFYNLMVPISGTAQFYSFGGYNYRFTNSYQYNRGADEARNVTDIYPNGFSPILQSVITDKEATGGVRGTLSNWNVDFSNTIGMNKFHYYSDSSLNASLGDASPIFFDDGGHQFLQNTTNLDFTRYFKNTLQGVNVAFGLENRLENYRIFAGQIESYETVPNIFSIDSVFDDEFNFVGLDTTYRPGGAQGFPGYSPANVVDANRSSEAAYIDVEADFTKYFMLDGAVRAEHYSDFGNTINWKVATRLAVNDKFAVRASVSTGFRAPSLAQIYYNNTYTNVIGGHIFDAVIASNVSPVTRALGIPALKQENAITASAGFTSNPFSGFSATVDGYYVQVKHRIVLTGYFTSDDPVIGPYLQEANVAQAQFFTNAVNTHSFGLDVVLNYDISLGMGHLNLGYIANFNKLTIDSIYTNALLDGKQAEYFGLHEQGFLKNSAPPSKMTLTVQYGIKKFNVGVDVNRWGKIDLYDYDPKAYSYPARFTADVNLGYKISKNVALNIGGVNVFNTYPQAYDPYETESGGAWDAVQMGFDGTFLYGKLGFSF